MSFTPGQCRAARALIGWSQDQLARASKVAKATIANFEAENRDPYPRTLDDIRAALEAAGVEFTNGGQPGVRTRKEYKQGDYVRVSQAVPPMQRRRGGRGEAEEGMTEDEGYFLANTALDAHEWRGVGQLANALEDFEPLAKRGNLGEVVAERLVTIGLAEKGRCSDRYASIGMTVGYRLSELGWHVKERGRWPRRR